MKEPGFGAIARLTRVWTRLYTAGMARDVRDRRRAEIESDIWESTRQLDRLSAGHILVRVLMGIPDDVSWRCSHEGAAFGVRVILTVVATSMVVAALVFLFSLGRATRLPTPEPVFHHVRALPAPPPPPPPPCAPPGLGRTSPSPCTP